MTTIRKQFIYELADDYLEKTTNLKKSAEWTYVGPDKIWVFVKTETNTLDTSNYFTLEEDGPAMPTPIDCTKMEIDCSSDPLFCTLVGAGEPVDGDRGADQGDGCLLYTSPSPRDRQKSRMPSSA